MASSLLTLTEENFQQEVLQSTTPVVVDFWAPWCQPCLMLTPTIEFGALLAEMLGDLLGLREELLVVFVFRLGVATVLDWRFGNGITRRRGNVRRIDADAGLRRFTRAVGRGGDRVALLRQNTHHSGSFPRHGCATGSASAMSLESSAGASPSRFDRQPTAVAH